MKSIVTIIVLMMLVNTANAQADTIFKFVKNITGDIVDFTVDNLDNVYILNSRNQVKKLNSNGDSVAIFNDVKNYGKASLIDVSNPLKVLLYYRDFATVVVLDRFLNAVNIIDLRKQNILQAKAIGQSYDNKIWVYDELESKLKKIDEEGKLLQETPDFRLLLGQAPSPIKIFDENKYVYLYDSLKGVYVFDYFGALRTNIHIVQWKNFKVVGKYIFGSKADTLLRYEIASFVFDEWRMPEEIYKSTSFNFTSSRLYALRKDGIYIYSIR
ncbi:hypothetical protein CAP36_17460 [Chitinophagaceae bacterium IBVUCB2]|nr:hypothetical protein CAP36_17460 [Chitinophagaceae bacterium IBVUCB2]